MHPLVDFISKIGFKVDDSQLKTLDNKLASLEKRLQNISNSLNSKGTSAALRLAAAETRLETARQKTLGMQSKLANNKELTAQARWRFRNTEQLGTNSIIRADMQRRVQTQRLRHDNARAEKRLLQTRATIALNESRINLMRQRVVHAQQMAQTRASRIGAGHSGPFLTTDNVGRLAGLEALRRFTMQSYQLGGFQVSQKPQFEFLTGSAEAAQQQIDFVNRMTDEYSLNIVEANKQFTKMLASGKKALGVEGSQELFRGFTAISTMLGLSNEEQKRAIMALGQMSSKGQVYAEEVRQQFAEAVPGGVQMFADALFGKRDAQGNFIKGSGNEQKFLDEMAKGNVKSEDLIEVARYFNQVADPKLIKEILDNNPQRAMNRLQTSWARFIMAINSSGLTQLMVDFLDSATETIKTATPFIQGFSEAVKTVWPILKTMLTLWATVWGIGKLKATYALFTGLFAGRGAGNLRRFAILMFSAGTATRRFAFAGKALTALFGRNSVLAAGLLLVVDLIETLQGKQTIFSAWMESSNVITSNLAKVVTTIGLSVEMVSRLFVGLAGMIFDDGSLEERWNTFTGFAIESANNIAAAFRQIWKIDDDAWFELGKFVAIAKEIVMLTQGTLPQKIDAARNIMGIMTAPSDYNPNSPVANRIASSVSSNSPQFSIANNIEVHTAATDPVAVGEVVDRTVRDTFRNIMVETAANYNNVRIPYKVQ